MKCPACEQGILKKKEVEYAVYGISLGKFNADVCGYCSEQWFDEKTALAIEKREKEKGLFGISKESKISYSGNSLIIRMPEKIARFMKLKKGKAVLIHPEGMKKIGIEIIE